MVIGEQYTKEIVMITRELYPKLKQVREASQKAKLGGDKLTIEGKIFYK